MAERSRFDCARGVTGADTHAHAAAEHAYAACLSPLLGCTLGYLCLCSDCGLAWGVGQG